MRFSEQQNGTVLNHAVSRTNWNMTSVFSLFSSVDKVSLPKIMSCTVVSDTDILCNISLFCSTYCWQWQKKMRRVFIFLTTDRSRVIYNMKVKAQMGTGDCCNSFSFAPVGCFPIWDHIMVPSSSCQSLPANFVNGAATCCSTCHYSGSVPLNHLQLV